MELVEMKSALRKSIQARLKALTPEQIKDYSVGIQHSLLALPQYQSARRIGIYLSMPDGEASTRGIVEHALSQGKQVYVPYLYKNPGVSRTENGSSYVPKRVMNMVSLHSLDDYQGLQQDKWGIPTPSEESIRLRKHVLGDVTTEEPAKRSGLSESLDLIVVPGVAFDRDGRRLGHGRGFYDFFLEEYRASSSGLGSNSTTVQTFPTLVALALPEQVLPLGQVIPTEDHDHRIDTVVTDKETIAP